MAGGVDTNTGKVIDRVNFADWPFMAKMTTWTIAAHMGILFGLINQLALAGLAIGLLLVIFRGYRMWWHRRPAKAPASRFGKPAQRGALRRLGPAAPAIVGTTTIAVSYLVPLLGVSLAAFLAIDIALGTRQRHRNGAATPPRTDPQELVNTNPPT